ncbi:MAG: Gfo/Idh/MocA family protein [Planctomycetaceae bacterium]
MRSFVLGIATIGCLALSVITPTLVVAADEGEPTIRVGVIGLDTSHSVAFTKELSRTETTAEGPRLRVVAAYPFGSRDIESSASRIPKITEDIEAMGVEVVDSAAELLKRVDCVLLETNDGRLHLEQAREVFAAKKPVFIDKPVAASLADVLTIYQESEASGVPMFSSSALRYGASAQAIRNGSVGKVLGCDAYSPCSTEPHHSDLYWYGIHGVETLFTCMGPGCESVTRVATDQFDVVTGKWSDGRIGTFRGMRAGANGYGGTAFGEKGIVTIEKFEGYQPLVQVIVGFFRTKQIPVPAAETIEIYAFMEAAAESKRQGGIPVTLASVIDRARPSQPK